MVSTNIKLISVPKEKAGTTIIYNNGGSGSGSSGSTQILTELQTHYLWGQPFNGTQDVNGDMEVNGNVTARNLSALHSVNASYVNVSEILRAQRADISTLIVDDASINNLIANDTTTHNLTVTGTAHFFELIIDKLRSVGGTVILSAANAKIDKVVSVSGGYKCYWRKEDPDRSKAISNDFLVNDQVICMSFNAQTGISHNVSNKYYWRLVTATGEETTDIDGEQKDCNYIILSNSVKDGDSAPEEGDEIMQLGYRGTDDIERQSAIIMSAYKTPDATVKSPAIVQYVGINDFNLSAHKFNYQSANGNHFVGDFSIVNEGTVTNITDYIEDIAEDINSSVIALTTDFYKLHLTQATIHVDINDNLNINILGCVKHYHSDVIETLENPSQFVNVTLFFNETTEVIQPTWVQSPAHYFRFQSIPHTQHFSEQSTQPKYAIVRMLFVGGQQLIDSIVIPVVFDSGSIFQVKSDAITAAVQQSNTYTDNSIIGVNNRIADVSLTANGLSSTVQSHTTYIDTLNSSVNSINSSISQIIQTADSISTRVTTIENGHYVSESALTQTANEIKAEINDGLSSTGIDITNGQITLSAQNTYINGNLNLYDSANNGLTIYDDSSTARVNIQSDAIDSISEISSSDTYTSFTLSTSATITQWDMTTATDSRNWTAGTTVDADLFSAYLNGQKDDTNYYPNTNTTTLYLYITDPSGTVWSKTVSCVKKDNYGRYQNLTEKVRFVVKNGGIHTIKYRAVNSSSIGTSITGYLNVNSRWQTASTVQTFIGRDGLYCHSGANKLLWLSESETQLRYGFNGIRWNDADVFNNSAMEVVASIKGSVPNAKPVWMPFYNYCPMYYVGSDRNLFTYQHVSNINDDRWAFIIDPMKHRGICYVSYHAVDDNYNTQESWVILPYYQFNDSDGEWVNLPAGYMVTIINDSGGSVFVCPDATSYRHAKIIDSNRNDNWYSTINGTQTNDTFIYLGTFSGVSTWRQLHDTQ